MGAWLIEGVILASALPHDGFSGLGECSVEPIPIAELNNYYQPQLAAIYPPPNQSTYEIPFAAMNAIGFYALHRITTTVAAATVDQAVAEAEIRFRRASVALAFTGSPIEAPSCSVRTVRWHAVDEGTGAPLSSGRPKYLVAEGRRSVEVVVFDKMGRAIDFATLAAQDEVTGRLFQTWYRAEQLYLIKARQDDRRWALQEYARLLEDIGNQTAPVTEPADYSSKMSVLKGSLAAALAAADTAEAIRIAIKAGSDDEARIRRDVTQLRIAEAGKILKVGEEAASSAAKTWTVRSRKAAHAKAGVITEDEAYVARAAAAVYLIGYLRFRQRPDS